MQYSPLEDNDLELDGMSNSEKLIIAEKNVLHSY